MNVNVILSLMLIITVWVPSLQAREWSATQGDVITVDINTGRSNLSAKDTGAAGLALI